LKRLENLLSRPARREKMIERMKMGRVGSYLSASRTASVAVRWQRWGYRKIVSPMAAAHVDSRGLSNTQRALIFFGVAFGG